MNRAASQIAILLELGLAIPVKVLQYKVLNETLRRVVHIDEATGGISQVAHVITVRNGSDYLITSKSLDALAAEQITDSYVEETSTQKLDVIVRMLLRWRIVKSPRGIVVSNSFPTTLKEFNIIVLKFLDVRVATLKKYDYSSLSKLYTTGS